MKFKHKVYDHKRKVGIDLGSFGPNSLGIRGQKGSKLKLCLISSKIELLGVFDMPNLTMYLDS